MPEHAPSPRHQETLADCHGRTIDYARIAITQRCNLRCAYCMSEQHAASAMTEMETAELTRIITLLGRLGVEKIRFTGGEPLIRDDIARLVAEAKQVPGIRNVSLTTNALLLDRHLDALMDAGIDALNISIDSLNPDRYREITRRDAFQRVMGNIERVIREGAIPLKLNVVMLRGLNDIEIGDFLELTRHHPVTVRFMELQPFDDNQIWRTGKFLGMERIRELLLGHRPNMQVHHGSGTEYYSFSIPGHKGKGAIIPAYTRNFCSSCNRIRITPEGRIISCLYAQEGIDLLGPMRRKAPEEELLRLLFQAAYRKPENGREGTAGGTAPRTSMSEIGG